MLDGFFKAASVVVPMAIMIMTGYLFKSKGLISPLAMRNVDTIAFRLLIPMLLFTNIYELDLNVSGVLPVLAGVAVNMTLGIILPRFYEPDLKKRAALSQTIMKSNFVIYGLTAAASIFGEGNIGTVALMLAIIVPVTNAASAVMLESYRTKGARISKIIISLFKNPLVISALLGVFFQVTKIRIPSYIYSVCKDFGKCATPMSFISLGASLEFAAFAENRKSLTWTMLIKMVFIPVVFIPVAVLLGFRGQMLCVFMIMDACPSAVSCYPMAVSMDADGPITAQMICLSTLFSLVTMFVATATLTSLGLLV